MQGGERAGMVACDAFAFGLRPDHVAGVVDETHERDVMGIAEFDEAGRLVRCRGVDGAGKWRLRLVGEDADRASFEASQGS